MISASLPVGGEALGALGLRALYPAPTRSRDVAPEFLPPPPRPHARYAPRRPLKEDERLPDVSTGATFPPAPGAGGYPRFLPGFPPYVPTAASYCLPPAPAFAPPAPRARFVPPAPRPLPNPDPPHEIPKGQHGSPQGPLHPSQHQPLPQPPPTLQRTHSPPTAFKIPGKEGSLKHRLLSRRQEHFRQGALIRVAGGALRRVEDMRTEDFVASAEACPELRLAECTVLRLHERGASLTVTLAYDHNRSKVELESSTEHPYFVYGQGWASCDPERTRAAYNLRVRLLRVGDVCVSLVPRATPPPPPPPPQAYPENLSLKEDLKKRRWSAPDACDQEDYQPPIKR